MKHMETTVGSALKRLSETQSTHTHLYSLFPSERAQSRQLLPQERLLFVPDLRRWITDPRLDAEEDKPRQMRRNLVVYRVHPASGRRVVHAEMELGAAIGRLLTPPPATLYGLFGARDLRADECLGFEPDLQLWTRDARLDDERVRRVELLREKWKSRRRV